MNDVPTRRQPHTGFDLTIFHQLVTPKVAQMVCAWTCSPARHAGSRADRQQAHT
jgi:hypothetical protein